MSLEKGLNAAISPDASAVARFEQARDGDAPASIESCLPAEDTAEYRTTLIELVLIDLEFGWKAELEKSSGGGIRHSAMSLQGYIDRFTALQDRELLGDLVVRTLCLQQQMGDQPDVRQCLKDHPGLFPSERALLSRLAATGYSLRSPTVSLAVTQDAQAVMSTFLNRGNDLAAAETIPPAAAEALTVPPAISEAMTVPPATGSRSDFGAVPDTVGNYRLERELGAGGMGRVYRATDLSSGQEVALKLVLPQLVTSEESMERFRQEGRLAGGITHPRCVFVLAADQDGRFPYIAMEFVPGTNLHDYVASQGPLEQEDAIRKIIDVIDGLSAAHELGVIHRDIKPANCFVDAEGRVKVGDFGLSRTLTADVQLTQPGAFLGTPQYCAPEQIRNDPLDDRCDVYSVVATLYFTLTGQAPFHGSDALATMARVVSDPAPPVRKLRPDLPRGLEKVIAKGLERDPGRRWQSMLELKNALTGFLPDDASAAGMNRRVGSFLIDLLCCFFWTMSTYGILKIRTGYDPSGFPHALFLSICIGYFTLCEGLCSYTIGKWMLKIRVRRYDRGGSLGLSRPLIRSTSLALICYLLPIALARALAPPDLEWVFVFFVTIMAPGAWMLVVSTMRRQNGYRSLHELISGTCVIQDTTRRARVEAASSILERLSSDRDTVTAADGDWPDRVGPYQVSHAVRWDDRERVLAAQDGQLNRNVWILLPESGCAPVSRSRAQLDRSSRLRWVSSGTCGENHFDAFLAPSGRSLDELVRQCDPLPWPGTRRLLSTLAEEIQQAIEDGTLPDQLSTYQVWLQPDGKALLVDFATSSEAQEVAGGLISPMDRGLALLGATAVRALEGGPTGDVTKRRSLKHVVRAVIPEFSRETLRRLFPGKDYYDDISEFQETLASDLERPVQEVTRLGRVKLSLLQTMFFFLVLLFGGLSWSAIEENSPGLLAPLKTHFSQALVATEGVLGPIALPLIIGPLLFSIWSMCFPGGWVWRGCRVQIVGRTGTRVSRLRAAWRTYITWFPFAALVCLQNIIPAGGQWSSLALGGTWSWVPWVVLAVIYLLISLIWPRRGPQDVLAGTYLVPR